MAFTAHSWQRTIKPRLRQILKVQQQIVFIGVLISAFFLALHIHIPLTFLFVCMFSIGNLMYGLQLFASRFYAERPFPWNWVLHLLFLTLGSFVSLFVAAALLRWMQPLSPPYWEIVRQSWRIVMVISLGAGIVTYAVQEVQRKLQEKNKLLEQAVERGNVVLQQQEQELRRALEIQKDLLPKDLPQLPGVELAGAWQPARTVGGDYFDVLRLSDNLLGICVGDVAGKGLTASLLMANLQAAFRAYATPDASPSTVCAKLNAFVCGNVAPGKFITFFYAILDAQNRTLTYENAGHCPGLLLRAAGSSESLCGHGGVLGVLPEWAYTDSSVQLNSGDRLLFFTDGVTEAQNPQAVEFGYDRIAQAAGPARSSAADTKRRVMEDVTKFCNSEFADDVTLVVVAIR